MRSSSSSPAAGGGHRDDRGDRRDRDAASARYTLTPSAGTSTVRLPGASAVTAGPPPGQISVKPSPGESVRNVAESADSLLFSATTYSTFSVRSMRLKA